MLNFQCLPTFTQYKQATSSLRSALPDSDLPNDHPLPPLPIDVYEQLTTFQRTPVHEVDDLLEFIDAALKELGLPDDPEDEIIPIQYKHSAASLRPTSSSSILPNDRPLPPLPIDVYEPSITLQQVSDRTIDNSLNFIDTAIEELELPDDPEDEILPADLQKEYEAIVQGIQAELRKRHVQQNLLEVELRDIDEMVGYNGVAKEEPQKKSAKKTVHWGPDQVHVFRKSERTRR